MQSPFSFVFYNTENLYDTIDDPDTLDDDFTPEGRMGWTDDRFNRKVYNISKVLYDIVSPKLPDIIGLAEVENRFVLEQILKQKFFFSETYDIVHYDSPDERGSDVGMIYNKNTFEVLYSEPILVRLAGLEDRTRDILYVKGKTNNGRMIHVLFNHWPSRREGTEESEARRFLAAGILRGKVDEILSSDKDANIVIMGDFNDTPENNSVKLVLKAGEPDPPFYADQLYNLVLPRMRKGIGSTHHKKWLMFDQIIVSGNMMDPSSGYVCLPQNADVFNPRYLLHYDKRAGFEPNRTSARNKYFGGYSDHLPVFLTIGLKFD